MGIVEWSNYQFEMDFDGRHYLAICQRTGHTKTQLCPGRWVNDLGNCVRNTGLVTALDAGVRRYQSEQDHRRQYARVTSTRAGRPVSGQGMRMPRPKRREPRQSGKVQT